MFIDETAVSTNMVLRGRAPRGLRLIGDVWPNMGDHHLRGRTASQKMTAPMVINGAMSGETFLAYVEQCWASRLRLSTISW